MDNLEPQKDLFTGLQFDEKAKSNIWTMARWAVISVIVTIFGYLLDIAGFIKQIMNPVAEIPDSDFSGLLRIGMTGGGIVSLLFTIMIGLVFCYFLYRFAIKAKQGIEKNDTASMIESFTNFKNYFLVSGIFAILAIVFVGFVMFVLLVIGAGTGFR
jgi:hypothetical protein